MDALISALVIFGLRLLDVPLSTLRVVMMVRGARREATLLAFFEALIWITAVSQVFKRLDSPLAMVAFAAGFSAGTAVGMAIEAWLAPGHLLVRVITRRDPEALVRRLRNEGFGLTLVRGEGQEGKVAILFLVVPRRRVRMLLRLLSEHDPKAFVTFENVQRAMGGHVPSAGFWPLVRR